MHDDEEGKGDYGDDERASLRNPIILFAIIEALVLVPLLIYMIVHRM
jgi:hypothetical protein